jgi:protein-disulfide isomerase
VPTWYESLPRVSMPVPSDGAAVLIVKFTDLQCPGCAATYFGYAPVISRYQAQYPGSVRVVTMDYPLQPECNSNVPRPIHAAACDAAVAVREVASRLGGVRDFVSGYAAAMAAIRSDVALATSLRVSSTPTFFVNGVRLPNSPSLPSPEQFDAIVAYELKRMGVTTSRSPAP